MTESNSDKRLQELELLAFIAKTANNPIFLLDAKGNIHWANKSFEKLYGYTLEEYRLLGEKADQEFIKLLNETDRSFFGKNPSLTFTRAIFTKSKKRKWVQSTLTPVKNSKGEIIQFIVIDADITQQKEVEDELVQRQENTQTISEHLESVKDYIEDQIKELNEQKRQLEQAKEKSEEVLNKVLPYEVAIQLKKKGYATPRHYKKVTLLHLNIRNFLSLTDKIPIEDLVLQLHDVTVAFDNFLEQHFVEKIKTIGGIYVGAGGVPLRNRSNPIDVVLAAIKIRESLLLLNKERVSQKLPEFVVGYGIHTGKAIAGVVGKNKLSYDIWGDTVNIAATIENQSESGSIIISEETNNEIGEYFNTTPAGTILLHTADKINLFQVTNIKPNFAEDEAGIYPNANFMQLLSKL